MNDEILVYRKTVLIVLNYNDCKTTLSFLEKIKNVTSIDKVVVVDNCSTDNSFKELEKCVSERIDVIKTESNGGYAKGNNYGIFYAIKEYNPSVIFVSNPDVEFDDKAVSKMINYLIDKRNIGAVTCRMNCTSGIYMPVAWKLPRYRDCLKENLILLKRILGDKTAYNEKYLNSSQIVKVDVVPGSMFAIRSEVFKEIQGFDERTFLYGEENLLAAKLKRNGYQSWLITDEEYIHAHSVSINKSYRSVYKRLKMGLDSRVIYCRDVLNVGAIRIGFLYLTFYIGSLNYILLTTIIRIIKHRWQKL